MGKKNQSAKRRQQEEEEGDDDRKMVNHKDDEEMKRAACEESDEEDQAMEQAQDDDEEEEEAEEEEEENDDDDAEERTEPSVQPPPSLLSSDGKYRNKQRCLVLCSRGVTARYRHLMEDLRTLLPHHKKESKLDPGKGGLGQAVNDIAAMRGCNSVLFLECRKRRDCYMWLGHVGGGGASSGGSSSVYTDGPSVKFHVTNVHTMDELRLTGNCMKGSRPILTFDSNFETIGHLKLIKELFVDVFGTPRGHPKSKPFVDRIMAFYHADKRVSTSMVAVHSK
jgi:ribosome biogenesis protein BRX1